MDPRQRASNPPDWRELSCCCSLVSSPAERAIVWSTDHRWNGSEDVDSSWERERIELILALFSINAKTTLDRANYSSIIVIWFSSSLQIGDRRRRHLELLSGDSDWATILNTCAANDHRLDWIGCRKARRSRSSRPSPEFHFTDRIDSMSRENSTDLTASIGGVTAKYFLRHSDREFLWIAFDQESKKSPRPASSCWNCHLERFAEWRSEKTSEADRDWRAGVNWKVNRLANSWHWDHSFQLFDPRRMAMRNTMRLRRENFVPDNRRTRSVPALNSDWVKTCTTNEEC